MTDQSIRGFQCRKKSRHLHGATPKMIADDMECIEKQTFWYSYISRKEPTEELSSLLVEFEKLVETWENAIKYQSLESQQIRHPAFLRIVAIGNKFLPQIFERFSRRPFLAWFRALEAITGEDPAATAESVEEAIENWKEWGRINNYLPK